MRARSSPSTRMARRPSSKSLTSGSSGICFRSSRNSRGSSGKGVGSQVLGSDPHERLPEVLTAHQPAESGRRAGKPVGDIFLVAKQARAHPTTHHSLELRKAVYVILNDDAA